MHAYRVPDFPSLSRYWFLVLKLLTSTDALDLNRRVINSSMGGVEVRRAIRDNGWNYKSGRDCDWNYKSAHENDWDYK